jgi:serine/threonine protein phosphatase PrpC
MFKGFKAIARGESHKEKEMPCQDAVFFKQYKNGGIIAVADGHGSEKHFRSDSGAALAVDIAFNTMLEFTNILADEMKKTRKNRADMERFFAASVNEARINQIERTVISRWRGAVIEHYRAHPLSDEECELCSKLNLDTNDENTQVRFYGTTLLTALLTDDFWFVIQIGDGRCVIINARKKAYFPALDDEALGFGKTTSL